MHMSRGPGRIPAMLRLFGLCISIGLADSLNPTTIAPALYLASGQRSRRRVAEFTLAVFVVYFLGGVIIALGPGQLLLSLVPHPHRAVAYVIELMAGMALVTAGGMLWRHRERLAERPAVRPQSKSSVVLGATITAVELPTAFPYFAAIAAIVGADLDPARQLVLLLVFNICFVLPLLAILVTLTFGGDRASRLLAAGRRFLDRHWPRILAVVLMLAGVFVIVLGATGFVSRGHSRFGRFFNHFRRTLHP